MMDFVAAEGSEAALDTDGQGDPTISVTHFGNEFQIYFYGCENNVECDPIQFFSGYKTNGAVRLVKVNRWNAEHRFVKAYVTETGSTRIEQDVFLGRAGLSAGDFAETLACWIGGMQAFETHIDWQARLYNRPSSARVGQASAGSPRRFCSA